MISIGQVIRGKYRLVRLLGDGGMGTVYEALHEMLGTRVAIKVLHADLARKTGLIDRFMQEARVAAQIQSPHVVHVIDVDRTDDGVAYIVMDLLEGEPLSAVLDRQGRLPIPLACEYAAQILSALEAAHSLGVVHRDLKPENVFLTYAGTKPILKLIDFGIAKLRRTDPDQRSLTVAGVVMGTAEYMAPEQAFSADRVDARSDVYAVGVMLYEMLAGKRPVAGEDARIIAMKVERGEVTPLVHAMPEVPREIAGLVHRAMAARPELRFASATEMRLALEGALSGKRVPTVPIPAAAQQAARAGEMVSATGTMQGAPAAEVLAAAALTRPPIRPGDATPSRVASGTNIEQEGPRTERAPPIPMALTPAPAPPSYYQSPPAYTGHPAPPKRGRGSAIWIAVALPLLIGGGVAAWLVASSDRDEPSPSPTLQTTPVATLTAPATQTATTAAPPGDTVAPLVPSPNGVPAGPTTAKPRPSGSHAPASPSGSATVPPNELPPPEFPPGIPTVLPFPVPSGSNIFTNPFPSGFPTSIPLPFPIPGAPPAQGSGADAGKSL